MTQYISLHNHTEFSILNATASPIELFNRAKQLEQDAIAITDYGTMAGMWSSLKASKETGVKLIAGCEIYFTDDVNNKADKLRYIVLLAKNYIGYKNLLSLNYEGFCHNSTILKRIIPVIDWNLLSKFSEGLICLTGCGNGIIGQLLNNKDFDVAETTFKRLKDIFHENLGAEVQAHNLVKNPTYYSGGINQVFTNAHTIRLANKLNIKIIPTSNLFYVEKSDAVLHDAILAIGSMQPISSNARTKYDVLDFYLRTGDEIKTFFARNHGEEFAEKICANTIEFANSCEIPNWIDPKFTNESGKELPTFPIEDENDYNAFFIWRYNQGAETKKLDLDQAFLRFRCLKSFSNKVPKDKEAEYKARLEKELDVLYYCGVSSYMLIVADYTNWAKNNGVSVGPGRGSVAGSLVAFLLGIHAADPIKYGLVFERFHNKLKQSYSDIDLDFSKKHRERVIEYVMKKYGQDHVAHISNIIGITPKVYARDISRVCELGGSRKEAVAIGTAVADTIPKRANDKDVRSFKDVENNAPLFLEYCKKYPELQKYSGIVEKTRAWGTHAAGIVIAKRPLIGLVPVRKDKDGNSTIEYDKDVVEDNGLVKMDLLGLTTLDIIDETNKMIKEAGKTVPIIDYDAYDKSTYDLITSGKTFGIFQFGISAGTIDLCRRIKPKSIEDLAIITTIARPASRAIRDEFIKTRDGKKTMTLMHPLLENALKDTFGFPIYDESLLIMAKDVANWDLGEADKLRKLTKMKGKDPKKALQWRSEFINDATNNGIDHNVAMNIWDKAIEPYSSYSFNKSHAITYSMISYHTAYLKAHFPVEFLLANLMIELGSSAADAEDNVNKIKSEIRKLGINILPPDLNKSDLIYKIIDNKNILSGLNAIKFAGDDAIKDIIEKRPFKDFNDFLSRVDTRKVSSKTIQALAASGCLDFFGISRKLIYLYCADYRKKIQVWNKKHSLDNEQFIYQWPETKNWSMPELYALERLFLNETFICGKKDAYIKQDKTKFFDEPESTIKKVKQKDNNEMVPQVKAEIKTIFEFKVKKASSKYLGEPMIKCDIEDEFGEAITLTIFPDKLKEIKEFMKKKVGSKYTLEPGLAIHFSAKVNLYEDNLGLVMHGMYFAMPAPSVPSDLVARKISMKATKSSKPETNDTISSIEDQLFEQGLIDLNLEDT
jgi:DNA polymerase III subunit alpha